LVNTDHFDGDHDFDCKIDGIGAMQLKSEFIKKVQAIGKLERHF